ncbi:MAG TPA: hypothetical protein VKR62_01645, partial [Roseiarcus sp.]|nr:hypothetical protein [Roseiarcus sp.]
TLVSGPATIVLNGGFPPVSEAKARIAARSPSSHGHGAPTDPHQGAPGPRGTVECSPLLGHRRENLDFLRRFLPYHRGVRTWRWLTILMNGLNQSDTAFGLLYRRDDASARSPIGAPNWKPRESKVQTFPEIAVPNAQK